MKTIDELVKALQKDYSKNILREPSDQNLTDYQIFMENNNIVGWEGFFCPEDNNYQDCFNQLKKEDVVFDIGAGDLRFDLIMLKKVKKVYSIEIDPTILGPALKVIGFSKPANLIVINGNGFDFEIPNDVTVITCLMIHRKHEIVIPPFKKLIAYSKENNNYDY